MASSRPSSTLRQLQSLFASGTATGLTDQQLLDRFNAGHAERDEAAEAMELAFSILVDRHGPMVWGVCLRVLGDVHEAEDAFQATFLILIRKAGSVRVNDSLGRWLYRVAHRVALRAKAESRRRDRPPLAASADKARDPGFEAELKELRTAVSTEVDRLPENCRSPIELCDFQGLTYDQAAKQLNWPLATLKNRLARGRQQLRARLARRGLDPSVAGVVAANWGLASPALPTELARHIVRVASSLSGDVASLHVHNLTNTVLKMMAMEKLKVVAVGLLVAFGLTAGALARPTSSEPLPKPNAEVAVAPKALVAEDRPGLLGVVGTVSLPDGSPAVGAEVTAIPGDDKRHNRVRTDEAGQFQIHDLFGNGGRLHVRSADGLFQTTLAVSSFSVRADFGTPLSLKLAPSVGHTVKVFADGGPVAGAHVLALGRDFEAEGITGADGTVRLQFPATDLMTEVVAWHPELGVDGRRELNKGFPQSHTELSLLPPAPYTISIVDKAGLPVVGIEAGISVGKVNSEWVIASKVNAAHARTNAQGMLNLSWIPLEMLEYIEVRLFDPGWKIDDVQHHPDRRTTTVRVCRLHDIEGKLVMPEGVSPEGVLITGFGFGHGNFGDIPYSRARRDGGFTIQVPAEYAYSLAIMDLQWASEPWSGLIVASETSKPLEIVLKAYPATPLAVKVTRGPNHDPVVDKWVEVRCPTELEWIDQGGKKRSSSSGLSGWLRTDGKGEAHAAVGKGPLEVNLRAEPWTETQNLLVETPAPLSFEFYRPWPADRKLSIALKANSAPFTPSPNLAAHAWTAQERGSLPFEFTTQAQADGTFDLTFDAKQLTLFLNDPGKHRSGFIEVGQEATKVDLEMVASGSLDGVLMGAAPAQPLPPQRALKLVVKGTTIAASAEVKADAEGRYHIADVPAGVPLQMVLSQRGDQSAPEHLIVDGDRLLAPGENRTNDRAHAQRIIVNATQTEAESPKPPLAKRLENAERMARQTGLQTLVVLKGDLSANISALTEQLLDCEPIEAASSFMILEVNPTAMKADAATIASLGWPKPAGEEVVFVALGDDQTKLASQNVSTKDLPTATAAASTFLQQHRSPPRDAVALLAEANKAARASDRRVWLIQGGPRCGPCFLLANALEGCHELLEKDYVIVKLMDGVDTHVDEVMAKFPRKPEDGIPWFAIAEPYGQVLQTSTGPLGNIGFPGSVEGLRHFRQMLEKTAKRLTPAEIDSILKGLESDS